MLDGLVNRQAVMIGYINGFHAMSIASMAFSARPATIDVFAD